MRNLFDDLGLGVDATPADVDAAYRRLAQRHHPDRNSGAAQEAHERMVAINTAYDVLSVDEGRELHRNALQLEALRRQMAELHALERHVQRQVQRNGMGWTLTEQGWMPEGGKA